MISKENIYYSLRNLWMRKSRSFLTILSIFIGITTIFIFISFGWGLYDYVNDFATGSSADKFWVEGKTTGAPGTSTVELTDDDIDTIEKTRGVIETIPSYVNFAEVEQDSTKKYVYAMGGDPKKMDILWESFGVEIEKGRILNDGDTYKVSVGYNYQLPDKIFPKGLDINDKILINGIKFKIVGFYESIGNPTDDSNLYFTEEGFKKAFPDTEGYALIYGRGDIKDMEGTVARIEKNLRKSRDQEEGQEDFYVASFTDQLEAFASALNIVIGFIILIAFISVIVSAVNTANTMVTSVLERVREIGVIKSIGAKNSEIFNIFLFESAFLGFVSGIIGVILGWSISATIGAIMNATGWGFLSPHFSPYLFIGCILFATVVGAISGVAPAINASRKRPVEALRYE